MYTAQLYPTSVRNTAVGTCSMMARVGGLMSPVIGKYLIVMITIYHHFHACHRQISDHHGQGGREAAHDIVRGVRYSGRAVRLAAARHGGLPAPKHL